MKPLYPAFLKLDGKPVLIVGAGRVAVHRIRTMLECGATVTVLAPNVLPEVQALASAGRIHLERCEFTPDQAPGGRFSVVVAATNDTGINRRVAAWARERHMLCNVVDDPDVCDFYAAAVYRDGPVAVAVSTTGAAPGLAAFLRDRIRALLPADLSCLAARIAALRRENRRRFPGTEHAEKRRTHLRQALLREWTGMIQAKQTASARNDSGDQPLG